jgi:hypothetical protein
MVKLEKQFRDLSLEQREDPQVRITELEDLQKGDAFPVIYLSSPENLRGNT